MPKKTKKHRLRLLSAPPRPEFWTKMSAHALPALVVGILFAWRGYMVSKLWATLACSIWLCVDFWFLTRGWSFSLANKRSEYIHLRHADGGRRAEDQRNKFRIASRSIIFTAFCLLIVFGMASIDKVIVNAGIQDVSNEVFQHIDGSLVLPAGAESMNTKFTIVNNSSEMIHLTGIVCHVNNMQFVNGWKAGDIEETPFFSGDIPLNPAGQGADSFNCPAGNNLLEPNSPIICGDLLWSVEYHIDYALGKTISKQYRFVLSKDEVVWSSVPLSAPVAPCKVVY